MRDIFHFQMNDSSFGEYFVNNDPEADFKIF